MLSQGDKIIHKTHQITSGGTLLRSTEYNDDNIMKFNLITINFSYVKHLVVSTERAYVIYIDNKIQTTNDYWVVRAFKLWNNTEEHHIPIIYTTLERYLNDSLWGRCLIVSEKWGQLSCAQENDLVDYETYISVLMHFAT